MRRNGFTLVEAIVSIGILSMIAFFMLSNMFNQYDILANSKKLTEDNFTLMHKIEKGISDIKEATNTDKTVKNITIHKGSDVEKKINSKEKTLFVGAGEPTKVTYFEFEYDEKELEMNTVVGRTRIPEIPAPNIKKMSIMFEENDADEVKEYGMAVYHFDKKEKKIVSELEMSNINEDILMGIKYQWLLSDSNYPLREYLRSDSQDMYFPVYPNNYQYIIGEEGKTIDGFVKDDEYDYRGKHITLLATPYSTLGKFGGEYVAKSIYIDGLPDLSDKGIEPFGHYSAGLQLLRDLDSIDDWQNFYQRQIYKDKTKDAKAIYKDNKEKPYLMYRYFEERKDGSKDTVFGQTFSLKNGSYFEIDYNAGDTLGGNPISVFAVINYNSKFEDMIKTERWELGFDKLEVEDSIEEEMTIDHDLEEGEWAVLSMRISNMVIDPITNELIQEVHYSINEKTTESFIMDPDIDIEDKIVIGNYDGEDDELGVAELLIYPTFLEEEEYNEVLDYLMHKYGIK